MWTDGRYTVNLGHIIWVMLGILPRWAFSLGLSTPLARQVPFPNLPLWHLFLLVKSFFSLLDQAKALWQDKGLFISLVSGPSLVSVPQRSSSSVSLVLQLQDFCVLAVSLFFFKCKSMQTLLLYKPTLFLGGHTQNCSGVTPGGASLLPSS